MGTVISIFLQASGIALIAGALRWLYSAKGPSLPRTLGDTNFYDIKWQWRAVGMAGGVFFIALSILGWHELDFRQREFSILITIIFLMSGVWISTGSVITNQFGITKRGILRSRTFGWSDITEIRLHKKQGGAIELLSGSQKLVVDFRIIAFEHLLSEIEGRTLLQPSQIPI